MLSTLIIGWKIKQQQKQRMKNIKVFTAIQIITIPRQFNVLFKHSKWEK